MNIEEAKIILQWIKTNRFYIDLHGEDVDVYEAINTVLNELDKKEKVIDIMAEWLYGDDTSFGYGKLKEINTPEKIKEYFYNKLDIDKKE